MTENTDWDDPLVAANARRWLRSAELMRAGVPELNTRVGEPASWPTLGPLLQARAETLLEMAGDDELWPPSSDSDTETR